MAKIKMGEDSPADLFILGQNSLSNKQNNKRIKHTFVQDSPFFEFYLVKIHHVQK